MNIIYKYRLVVFSLIALIFFSHWLEAPEASPVETNASIPKYIDVHNHLVGRNKHELKLSLRTAVSQMDRLGVKKLFIVPPPFPPGHRGLYDDEVLYDIVQFYPDRFGFLAGGGTLNVMIQKAVHQGTMDEAFKEKFKKQANILIEKGALGFGELAAEHLCLGLMHNYQSAPPDHPLFLLLADIAASHTMPIDIHMEAVPKQMPIPAHLAQFSANPITLAPNIKAFERLLAHNRKAKIIWDHCGWDNTGKRTVALDRQLLTKHPNLYMSFKISYKDSTPAYQPIDRNGKLKAEWLAIIKDFPDRFMIGSDHFFLSPQIKAHPFPPSFQQTHEILSQLPPNLARKVGYENAINIFNMKGK